MSVKRKKTIKFLTVYNSFSEKEKNEFKKFIKNGLVNNNRNYLKILSSLKINEKGIAELTETDNNRTRWNRLSELSVLADKFLIYKSIESDSFESRYILLKEFSKRGLNTYFEHNYKDLMKDIESEHNLNFDHDLIYKLNKIIVYREKTTSDPEYFMQKFSETNDLRNGIFLMELLEDLIKIWNKKAAGILKTETLDEEIFKGIDFEKVLSKYLINSKSPDKFYYILKFLYLIYMSLDKPEETENYLKAKRIFFRDLKMIPNDKRSDYYNYITSLLLERANRSLPGAMEELFYMINRKFDEGLTEDILYNEMPINKFRDYVYVAVNLGKLRWARKFLKKYGKLLPDEIREDTISLTTALILYNEGKFLKCFDIINKVKKKESFSYVDVSVLKLKVLYELQNFDKCFDVLKNFKEYLRKERVIQDHLKLYAREFCRDFDLLLMLKQNPDKNKKADLEYRLNNYNLIGKKWIISKMKEI